MVHRIASFLALALVVQASAAAAQDTRPDQTRLAIMTFNAEFLWDGRAPEEGQVNFAWKHSPTEADDHMEEIAQVIIRNNPDIVNLVEVEGLDALNHFNDTFLSGMGYSAHLVKGKDTFTGQDVGILTRIALTDIDRDERFGTSGTATKKVSKHYVATLTANGLDITVIGLHFLARPLSTQRQQDRQAQADAIRQMAEEQHDAGRELIILGDFNDFDGVADSRDHVDNLPITTVLSQIRTLDAADQTDDLANVAAFLPQDHRFTSHFDKDRDDFVDAPGELSSIDHILLSPGLADRIEDVVIDQTHDPLTVSDHFPITVTLRFTDGGAADGVRIRSLLPNPTGAQENDTEFETVTLVNLGSAPVDLTGWTLRDKANRTWSLDALDTLDDGDEVTIQRNGQPMALNNTGDTVHLINDAGNVVDTVIYGPVDPGEAVETGH